MFSVFNNYIIFNNIISKLFHLVTGFECLFLNNETLTENELNDFSQLVKLYSPEIDEAQ